MSILSFPLAKFLVLAIPIMIFIALTGVRQNTEHSTGIPRSTSPRNQIITASDMENGNGITHQKDRHQGRKILDHDIHLQSRHQKEDSILTPDSSIGTGYVFSIRYPGQQGAGIRAMASFQCFLGSLTRHLSIVEPFLEDTRLKGISSNPNRLKLSSLFDLEHFNAASRQVGNPELIRVDEFIRNRPRSIILVIVKHAGSNVVTWNSPRPAKSISRDKIRCLESDDLAALPEPKKQEITTLMKKMRELESKKTCVVRTLELYVGRNELNRTSILDLIFGEWLPEEVTLVFDYWSGHYSIPVSDPANGMNCKLNFKGNGTKFQFKPSQKLMNDAERYRSAYLGGSKSIAVMMRIEKVTNEIETVRIDNEIKGVKGRYSSTAEGVEQCFKAVLRLKNTLDNDSKTMPLVTMDFGGYGSTSFRKISSKKEVLRLSNETFRTLYENKWSIEEWEESFIRAAGGKRHKGYIAALQRILASSADCLVLLGGGNFQALALQDYLRHHQENLEGKGGKQICVHLLCMARQNDAYIRQLLTSHYQPL